MARAVSSSSLFALLGLGLGVVRSAHAAPPPSLDLRGFSASTDPNAGLYLEPAKTPGHLAWNVGVWASYAYRLLEIEAAGGDLLAVPVRHQLSLDYVASLGLSDRLALGVVLPSIAYQVGDDVTAFVADARSLPHTALGDLSFIAKAALVPSRQLGGFALSALARVALPTGDSASYVSEAAAGGELRALAELDLVALVVRATGGMRVRGAEQEYAGASFGHELPWGLGFGFRPQVLGLDTAGRWQWNLEGHGALALTPSFAAQRESPVLIGASARYGLGDFGLVGGAEVSLSDAVGAPRVRPVLGLSYAPRVIDTDADEIPDERDECAELAEDRDGFEDQDGCPDFDNDDDGVPDDEDKCPRALEDSDGVEDSDGCPDPDNDHDGLRDQADKCPNEPGAANGAEPGCPQRDRDVDGIPDPVDKCPTLAEDRDAFRDQDGCPDLDDDEDGVLDSEDSCPRVKGKARSDPALNGCPSPDRDGDTFDDDKDRCPEAAEDFDGEADTDGCAEPEGPAVSLARWTGPGDGLRLGLSRPLKFDKEGNLSEASEGTLRAIALLLNQKPGVVLLVGVRPERAGAQAEQLALNRSFAVVEAVRRYTHSDEIAETIGWSAVRKLPGAEAAGVGFLVLAPEGPLPVAPKP